MKNKTIAFLILISAVVLTTLIVSLNWSCWENSRKTVKVKFGNFDPHLIITDISGFYEGYDLPVVVTDGTKPFTTTIYYASHEEQQPTQFTSIYVNGERSYYFWKDWQEQEAYWTYAYDLIGGRHTINVEEIN